VRVDHRRLRRLRARYDGHVRGNAAGDADVEDGVSRGEAVGGGGMGVDVEVEAWRASRVVVPRYMGPAVREGSAWRSELGIRRDILR
jgi:hypothetical protein